MLFEGFKVPTLLAHNGATKMATAQDEPHFVPFEESTLTDQMEWKSKVRIENL